MWKYNKQSGFTLVELAIVLVIIGLLLGGVLKGQEMIENGKIKNLQNDVKGVTAAYYAYRDRYNALPGDDPKAAARWSASPAHMAVATSTGDGVVGTADGWNLCAATAATTENCSFMQDLRLAGLITGAATPADPINAYGGVIRVVQNTITTAKYGAVVGLNLCFTNLPAKAAEAVDAGFDDGDPTVGNVRAAVDTTNHTPLAVFSGTAYTDPNTYTVCKLL
ncbi:MAG: prepilin-type N-terminal cleavage/methylation domain-containing protein [Gallionella sp.]|nr:prepilin-type N-terminal cleavage/methylation domain-containing protein [Gallionella sp.]